MGFELTQGAVFYVIMMIIVVFIGLAIVVRGNPIIFLREQQLSAVFEPGKFIPKTDAQYGLSKYVQMDCTDAVKKLILKDVGFTYGDKPGSKLSTADFMVILTYDNKLFLGKNDDMEVQRIRCNPVEGSIGSDCPQTTLKFFLSGVNPHGRQVFHFTAWKWSDELKNQASDSATTLDKLLDTFSRYYVSSFDATFNVDDSCQDFNCRAIPDEATCRQNNQNRCYWGGWWNDCKLCPDYGLECTKYDKEQCIQCPVPAASCVPGTLWGCNPLEP